MAETWFDVHDDDNEEEEDASCVDLDHNIEEDLEDDGNCVMSKANGEVDHYPQLTSFLQVDNSFFSPWSWNPRPSCDDDGVRGLKRMRMIFQPGSFFTYPMTKITFSIWSKANGYATRPTDPVLETSKLSFHMINGLEGVGVGD